MRRVRYERTSPDLEITKSSKNRRINLNNFFSKILKHLLESEETGFLS